MNSTLKYKEIVHNIAKHTQQSIGVAIVRKDYKLSWLQNRKKYGGDDGTLVTNEDYNDDEGLSSEDSCSTRFDTSSSDEGQHDDEHDKIRMIRRLET